MGADSEYLDYALQQIKHICDQFGPRPAGSDAEAATTKYLHKELGQFCNKTYVDEFPVYPTYYPHGFVKISAILLSCAMILCVFPLPFVILGGILFLFALFLVFISLFLMKLWFVRFFRFPQRTSHNATGKIYPRNDPPSSSANENLKVIIAGHTDSAYEMTIAQYGHKYLWVCAAYLLLLLLCIGIKLLTYHQWYSNSIPAISVTQYWEVNILDALSLGSLLSLYPFFLKSIIGITNGQPVMGANDNLSGVGIALALGKYFAETDHRLRNIELWLGSFGAEECGERGSHYFVQEYGHRQSALTNAVAIIPESVGAGDHLHIILEEKMHFAKHDPELCAKIHSAFIKYRQKYPNSAKNQTLSIKSLPFAASDAGRFAHAGIPSAMIIAFDDTNKPPNYHMTSDRPENLSFQTLETVFGGLKQFLIDLDNELDSKT